METDEPASLEHVMARLAAGDQAYTFTLASRWYAPIARLVRSQLTEMGRADLARQRDEVDGLVIDACFVIADRAGGWRPGGASPWGWAKRAIRASIARSIGHRCVELDDGSHDRGEPPPVDLAEYHEVVANDERFASFDEVLRACANERDQHIVIEYLQQQAAGDPSPSHTVAALFGLTPATVRQVNSRTMRKIRALLGSDASPLLEEQAA